MLVYRNKIKMQILFQKICTFCIFNEVIIILANFIIRGLILNPSEWKEISPCAIA